MSSNLSPFKRRLRLCYWDAAHKYFGAHKLVFEKKLKLLGDLELVELKTLDDARIHPCDVLIVAAEHVPEHDFGRWLADFRKKVLQQNRIWVPALFLSRAGFEDLEGILSEIVATNWYFDILNPDHVDSLPVRVANLLRIHDHLHELQRYDARQQALQTQVAEIEKALQTMRDGKNG